MSGSRRAGTRATSRLRCTARCTSADTASTRPASPHRCSAPRWATASHSGCTSPRAGCGRTWSVADARSARCWRRSSREHFGGSLIGLDADTLYRAVNRIRPSLHPRRVRRGDIRAAHRAALRARAAADRRQPGNRGSARGMERAVRRVLRDRGRQTTPTACLQDVHWSAGLIGYFPTYALGNLIAGQLWERVHVDIPDLDDAARGRRVCRRCASGCSSTSTATGRSSRPRNCSSGRSAVRSTVGPFVHYLKRKLSDVYGVDLGA